MKTEQDMLLTQIDKYWECFECGRVIDDPSLTKALETAGMGWGLGVPCPKCGSTVSKSIFPDERFRPLFEMIDDSRMLPDRKGNSGSDISSNSFRGYARRFFAEAS